MGMQEDELNQTVTRQHNRVLRIVHRKLRETARRALEDRDRVVRAVFTDDAPSDAELAMADLWQRGEFENLCDPHDYEYIVGLAVNAIRTNTQRVLSSTKP